MVKDIFKGTIMYKCRACRSAEALLGGERECAFATGLFSRENSRCATLEPLRDLVYEGQPKMPPGIDYQYCSDQKYATVDIDDVYVAGQDGEERPIGLALWITWYKSRGATEACWILDSDAPPRPPTEDEVLAIVAAYASRRPAVI